MNNVRTKSGIEPVDSGRLPFEVTTDMVENFLQERMDKITDTMRKNGIDIDDIEVSVMSTLFGKGYLPFMLILPTAILEDKNSKKSKKDDNKEKGYIPDAFKTSNGSAQIKIYDPISVEMQAFSFSREEKSAFFSRDWRNRVGVSLDEANTLKYNSTPRIQRYNHGNASYVTCMIDPLKVFKSMLEDTDGSNDYFIEINKFTKIRDGVHKYFITRVPEIKNGKKNKNRRGAKDRLIREVTNTIRRR